MLTIKCEVDAPVGKAVGIKEAIAMIWRNTGM